MHLRSSDSLASAGEIERFLEANPEIADIDAFVIDVNGHVLGKRVPSSKLAQLGRNGLQFSASSLLLDCRGMGQNPLGLGFSDGDPDGTALPVPGTLVPVPWGRHPTGQVLLEMREPKTLERLWYDPRRILADVAERCRADGLHPVMACELEFYLLERTRLADGGIFPAANPRTGRAPATAANLSLTAVEDYAGILKQMEDAAKLQGLPVCSLVAEYGLGQFEINLEHQSDPVLAADQAVLLRRLVKGVAGANGLEATFMPKPFRDQPGNGLHVHVSVTDKAGGNRFGGDGGEGLLESAVAGMQAFMFDSIAVFAPHFNAYRRYLGLFVPTTRDWAYDNRSVAFRIPAGQGESRRIEHRVSAADASPHLALALVLAGLHHGIAKGLKPTSPAQGRVTARDSAFPTDLLSALARFERSSLIAEYLPAPFLKAYAELKRGEYAELIDGVFPREYDFYL